MLKNLVQSTQNCNTVSRQRIHNVSSQVVAVHKLKSGHCCNIFLLLLNNFNVVMILSRAIFSERQSHILFCNFNKNLQWVMHTAKYAEVEPN